MDIVDVLEAWWLSVRDGLEADGVVARFHRWPASAGMDPICILGLERGRYGAELTVFHPAEGGLVFVGPDEAFENHHCPDLRDPKQLGALLARMLALVSSLPPAR